MRHSTALCLTVPRAIFVVYVTISWLLYTIMKILEVGMAVPKRIQTRGRDIEINQVQRSSLLTHPCASFQGVDIDYCMCSDIPLSHI